MINIDCLTIGCEFKDVDGNIFKVSSNFSQINKLFVELERVTPEPSADIIKE